MTPPNIQQEPVGNIHDGVVFRIEFFLWIISGISIIIFGTFVLFEYFSIYQIAIGIAISLYWLILLFGRILIRILSAYIPSSGRVADKNWILIGKSSEKAYLVTIDNLRGSTFFLNMLIWLAIWITPQVPIIGWLIKLMIVYFIFYCGKVIYSITNLAFCKHNQAIFFVKLIDQQNFIQIDLIIPAEANSDMIEGFLQIIEVPRNQDEHIFGTNIYQSRAISITHNGEFFRLVFENVSPNINGAFKRKDFLWTFNQYALGKYYLLRLNVKGSASQYAFECI